MLNKCNFEHYLIKFRWLFRLFVIESIILNMFIHLFFLLCLVPVGFAMYKVCCRCTDTFAVDRPSFCLSGVCMWTNILALIWKSGPHCTSYRCRNQTVYNDLLHTLIFWLFLFFYIILKANLLYTITIKPAVYHAYVYNIFAYILNLEKEFSLEKELTGISSNF